MRHQRENNKIQGFPENLIKTTLKSKNDMAIKTTENIDGKDIEITWSFKEIVERHDSNWCEWLVEGEDNEGNQYTATCQADGSEPSDSWDEIIDVEKE